ncbi:MAG: zinc ribbon domain-containing protein [Thermoplasmatota archaeon]
MKYLNKFLGIGLVALLMASLLAGTALAQDDTIDEWDWAGGGLFAGMACLFWVVMLIIWIAIGVWMYKDAEKRGKSGALWLIIGLLLGIIGLIVWLIVRPPEPSFYDKRQEGQEPGEDDRRRCPECGRNIPFDASVCPYCGKRFGE